MPASHSHPIHGRLPGSVPDAVAKAMKHDNRRDGSYSNLSKQVPRAVVVKVQQMARRIVWKRNIPLPYNPTGGNALMRSLPKMPT
jgi:hypothetical protein